MDKKEFLQFRNCRREIIDMCYRIYQYDLCEIDSKWKLFRKKMSDLSNSQIEKVLHETEESINKKNWIRTRDMLLYIDDYLRKTLKKNCLEFQIWREDIWKENLSVLKKKNMYLAEKIETMEDALRVEVKAGGTECCEIRIHEREIFYQLFSLENPWLESMKHLELCLKQQCNNIYQWGFNAGFLTGVLENIYYDANIYVYISNLDIFRAVLKNICLENILNNKKLFFIYDPTGLEFADIAASACYDEKNIIFIDQIEYRAFVRGEKVLTDIYLNDQDKEKTLAADVGTVGRKIYMDIKNKM